ncbi:MAG: hypothetical protein H6685_12525 [Deltaproteobacteria bacterium]|nr:hypothetical protein [Deltaproteobacteria bacterium]
MSAVAQDDSPPPLFEDASDYDLTDAPDFGMPPGAIKQRRAVRVHVELLEKDDGRVAFNAFGDDKFTFKAERIDRRGPKDFSWIGRWEKEPMLHAIIVVKGDDVVATVNLHKRQYQLRPIKGVGDVHLLMEIDQAAFNAYPD